MVQIQKFFLKFFAKYWTQTWWKRVFESVEHVLGRFYAKLSYLGAVPDLLSLAPNTRVPVL